MNKPIITVSVITVGLLTLAVACQQPDTQKSTSKWHLAPAPSTAAGYGETSQSPAAQEQTQPAASGGYGTTPPVVSEPTDQQPSTSENEAQPPTSTWKIKPPPDAAGYGKGI